MFAIVIFKKSNSVAIVPVEWLTGNTKDLECWWPPYKTDQKIEKAVRTHAVVGDNWTSHQVRVLLKNGES